MSASETNTTSNLLLEIDRRQDDVLERLDELNRQIENLVAFLLTQRDSTPETAAKSA